MTEARPPAGEPGDGPEAPTALSSTDPTETSSGASELAPDPPPPSPFARLSTRPGRVLAEAFELLARATGDVRRGSFYIGLLIVGVVAPFAILVWRIAVEFDVLSPTDQFQRLEEIDAPLNLLTILALGAAVVAYVESRAIAATLLGARLEGRPLPVRRAVANSRRVFWRVVRASLIVSIPVVVVQLAVEAVAASTFHGTSEASLVTAAIVTTILVAPLGYVVTGVVLGDVGARDAVRRSVRLFRARKVAALVVALFAWAADLLTGFGIAAGLDLVVRATDLTAVFGSQDAGTTVLAGLILVALTFAVGTLLFTVTAIALAPQVVMFVALTHVAPGLEVARTEPPADAPRFRWLTRPWILLVIAAVGILVIGLIELSG